MSQQQLSLLIKYYRLCSFNQSALKTDILRCSPSKLKNKKYIQPNDISECKKSKKKREIIITSKPTEILCFNSNLYSFGKFTICYNASNLQYAIFSDVQTYNKKPVCGPSVVILNNMKKWRFLSPKSIYKINSKIFELETVKNLIRL